MRAKPPLQRVARDGGSFSGRALKGLGWARQGEQEVVDDRFNRPPVGRNLLGERRSLTGRAALGRVLLRRSGRPRLPRGTSCHIPPDSTTCRLPPHVWHTAGSPVAKWPSAAFLHSGQTGALLVVYWPRIRRPFWFRTCVLTHVVLHWSHTTAGSGERTALAGRARSPDRQPAAARAAAEARTDVASVLNCNGIGRLPFCVPPPARRVGRVAYPRGEGAAAGVTTVTKTAAVGALRSLVGTLRGFAARSPLSGSHHRSTAAGRQHVPRRRGRQQPHAAVTHRRPPQPGARASAAGAAGGSKPACQPPRGPH